MQGAYDDSRIAVNNNLGFANYGANRRVLATMGAIKDPLAERIRVTVVRLMDGMEQAELARLSKQRYDQVHKFVNADLPFPPLSFLDNVLRVFGSSLAAALGPEPVQAKPPVLSEAEAELLKRYRRMPASKRKTFGELAKDLAPDRARRRAGG